MILTHDEILKELDAGRIKIDPFNPDAVGPASINLTLDNKLRVFTAKDKIIEEDIDYEKITKTIISEHYILKPGELVLGITKETVTLPENICGFLNSRSRFARIGLMSHVTAPFICPGISNKQVLEIYNAGPNSIKLIPGTEICHLVLAECKGSAKYTGKFKDQEL